MEGLFNPLSILLHVVNAAILLIALYFLLYKPVRKFMNERSERIRKELESVSEARMQLEQERTQAQEEVKLAKRQATDAAAQSLAQVQLQTQQMLAAAHTDAERTLRQARASADAIMKNAQDDIRDEIASFSVELAGKILQREVKEEDHHKLVEDFIKKVG